MPTMARRPRLIASLLLTPLLAAGCVSRSAYDSLQAENSQLRQQLAAQTARANAEQRQVGRLQDAIAYTVNSDLLFRPGSWEMNPRGEQIIGDLAKKLAPT